MAMEKNRYDADALRDYARNVLGKAGLASGYADDVARTLVEGDLMGHDTHGLALLSGYVRELQAGTMTCDGKPEVVSDRAATLLWDGHRLPGPALVHAGIDALIPRVRELGSATLVIRRSHHIACLAAYLLRATESNLVMMLASSDPSVQSVAPFGGTRPLFTPNPIALGVPTSTTPILIDISSSVTTNAMSARLHQNGQLFDEPWMLDAHGDATRDPGVLFADPPGTILPLGGLSAGHKGFGLALLIEALTGGLAGFGRADPAEGWGATVFMTLYDPAALGGIEALRRQMDWLGDACRGNAPRVPHDPVRLPGDRAMARRGEQLAHGVRLRPAVVAALEACGARYGIPSLAALDVETGKEAV
ncbi:Malate/lactate/ureidoglycolate dehydrogenase, LDH2 family [Burkholderia sp. YR290]|jgi:L-lactate dehydrogenase|uniref:Ldh family oxidoreductase n=1 Tax=Paraburkholderia hospita TaxID=169430 RepID=UPI0009A758D7|nr:Ldh family oxidoreductase [Paraburkholderia hospita]SKC89257.1 Malate/lactate/ureidoglycolate dehydrogenase, LDH2 family [Paraburkholderia hospita]SOE86011.1 Malate/lactate/ureidoglycolate dehydrogenase, LDH2 family [Burkholderia sp. YR290]